MLLEHKDILELLDLYDFELIVNANGSLSVKDLQYANLGGIESKEFKDYKELMDGLSTYHYDYWIRPYEDELNMDYYDDPAEFIKRLKELGGCSYFLEMIEYGYC